MTRRVKIEEDAVAVADHPFSDRMQLDQDSDSDSSADDEDEVVREIDVFLSPELSQQLCLLQYPGQHESSSITTPISARIKPRHGMIEAEHPAFHRTTRTYQSQTIPVTTHLCLGKLLHHSDGKDSLQLVPLAHITQMRPSFQHLAEDADDLPEEEVVENDDVKKPIGFQRKETDRAAAARKSSYAFKKASQEAEAWIDLNVVPAASEKSKVFMDTDDDDNNNNNANNQTRHAVLQKVVCPNTHQLILAVQDEKNNDASYVQSLNYLPVITTAEGFQTHPAGNDLKNIVAKLTSLLQLGGPIPFSILRSQFSIASVPDECLFQALNVCAVLCRGNWCLHSKFLAVTDRMKQVRTLLLLLLQDKGVVSRTPLIRVFSKPLKKAAKTTNAVSPERLLSLLKLVAKQVAAGWVLKIDDDINFLERHPDLRELHESYWERQRVRFARELRVYEQNGL